MQPPKHPKPLKGKKKAQWVLDVLAEVWVETDERLPPCGRRVDVRYVYLQERELIFLAWTWWNGRWWNNEKYQYPDQVSPHYWRPHNGPI